MAQLADLGLNEGKLEQNEVFFTLQTKKGIENRDFHEIRLKSMISQAKNYTLENRERSSNSVSELHFVFVLKCCSLTFGE